MPGNLHQITGRYVENQSYVVISNNKLMTDILSTKELY